MRTPWRTAIVLALLVSVFHIALALPLLAADPPAAGARTAKELRERFQAGLDQIVTKHQVPGITAAYLLPGEPMQAFASGLADKESQTPMAADTRMLAGS